MEALAKVLEPTFYSIPALPVIAFRKCQRVCSQRFITKDSGPVYTLGRSPTLSATV